MSCLYNYWLIVTSLESPPGRKETRMFYLANIITFNTFLELLCKYALLLSYKLNIFHPLQVNQFDICELLFGGYTRFILLDKMVLYC